MIYILDSDASKVIEAVRSTGVVITQPMIDYAHYICKNMKAIGTWDLCNAIYGFVGGTADSHKWNWKDLRDDDSAFRLTFFNSPTSDSNGVQFDGINQYANTYLTPSISLANNSTNITIYVKESSATTVRNTPITIGAVNSPNSGNNFLILNRHNSSFNQFNFFSTNTTSIDGVGLTSSIGTSPFLGSISGNLLSNIMSLFWQGNKVNTNNIATTQSSLPNIPMYIGVANNVRGVVDFDNKLINFTSIGAGLTDIQAIQQSEIVKNAQSILNRA